MSLIQFPSYRSTPHLRRGYYSTSRWTRRGALLVAKNQRSSPMATITRARGQTGSAVERRKRPALVYVGHASEVYLGSEDELTGAELSNYFAEVLAALRARHADPQSAAALEAHGRAVLGLLRTRIPGLKLNRSTVRVSPRHGLGLFALRDLIEGELITLYPGDALLMWGSDGPGPPGSPLSAQFGEHVSPEEQNSPELFLRRSNARDYEIAVHKRLSIVGDPVRRVDNPAYLGHIANDAAALMSTGIAARNAYSRDSALGSNAAHLGLEGCHFGTFATRSITAGEEVLVSYGEGYWLSRVRQSHALDTPIAPVSSDKPPRSYEQKGKKGRTRGRRRVQ